mmetsp:Transcript_93318/g.301915  ORF Transcript_93318/g.301915 Transcript_93318/m.301915 type:complete len:206 (+) Transcript_93318:699-1316(+)
MHLRQAPHVPPDLELQQAQAVRPSASEECSDDVARRDAAGRNRDREREHRHKKLPGEDRQLHQRIGHFAVADAIEDPVVGQLRVWQRGRRPLEMLRRGQLPQQGGLARPAQRRHCEAHASVGGRDGQAYQQRALLAQGVRVRFRAHRRPNLRHTELLRDQAFEKLWRHRCLPVCAEHHLALGALAEDPGPDTLRQRRLPFDEDTS